jgi:hypothetical protein
MMTRREILLRFSGITGLPVMLGSCSMESIRRGEANLGWRMKHPGTGVQFSGLPEVVKVMILATYPPTPVQTQVAEQRARKAVASIARKHPQHSHSTVAKTKSSSTTKTAKVAHVSPEPKAAVTPAEEVKTAAAVLKQETGTTVIAVDTQADSRLKGDRAVMLWNTQTQRFVGNNVYDISSPPAQGQVAQWGSTTARYVGSGSL